MSATNINPPVARPRVTIIEAGRGEQNYWRDLWRFRELLGYLAWRDIKVRYKQTVLGVTWVLIQPLVTVAIFTFVFGRLAKMPSGDIPYPLLVMAGQLAWQLFSNALSNSSGSLIGNGHLISKVYFPRLVVPLAAVVVAVVDFCVVFVLFIAMAAWFGVGPSWRWMALPFLVGFTLFTALGAGLWLAALTVRFRDFRYVVPFLLQIGLFVTPIGFRTDFLPNWRDLLSLNPMAGVVDAFRWALLGTSTDFYGRGFSISLAISALLLLSGIWYFRRTERSFADDI
jgi:lipopolysaccharide transport system permease protein